MANAFGTDILIQAENPMKAANFYVKELGFAITDKKPNMVSPTGETSISSLSGVLLLDLCWRLRSKA